MVSPEKLGEDFNQLLEFIKTTKFDKLGAFTYSKEEGTPAARLPNQIHGNTKKSRYNKLMELQQGISKSKLKEKINSNVEVLIEAMSFDKKYFIGRTMQDAPEIDGIVYIKNNNNMNEKEYINKFVNCKIIDISEYDLIAEIIK